MTRVQVKSRLRSISVVIVQKNASVLNVTWSCNIKLFSDVGQPRPFVHLFLLRQSGVGFFIGTDSNPECYTRIVEFLI